MNWLLWLRGSGLLRICKMMWVCCVVNDLCCIAWHAVNGGHPVPCNERSVMADYKDTCYFLLLLPANQRGHRQACTKFNPNNNTLPPTMLSSTTGVASVLPHQAMVTCMQITFGPPLLPSRERHAASTEKSHHIAAQFSSLSSLPLLNPVT